ncbi:alanine racemase [Pseudomonas aeruginosa]|uniref:alanine racemase n=1 Tax=Pseudomonas aeruginosa TaxID=287 RepID=UPI001067D5A3|nr:alanine racemase [Pseudomonas aeruginosa]TEN66522.1 alanine racemase [Pseudomonas aeruginosa]
MRPLVATVDLSAIRHNYALAKRCAPQRQAFAVVKANAYGHGAREVVTALHDDADGFAVACLEEAAEVRALHASARILLLEGCFEASEYALAGQLRLDLVIQGAEQGEAFLAAGLDIPLNVWLKLDSGMHRLGFDPAALRAWHARLRNHPGVRELNLISHFACADERNHPLTEQQLESFLGLLDLDFDQRSLANSAAVLTIPAAHMDWLRPGIMLYGSTPLADLSAAELGLRPAMSLGAQLISLREVAVGESVGYGATWIAGGGGGGRRATLAGRVSMDMLAVDLSDLPEARVGDPVELWGAGLSVDEVARACGTLGYELLSKVTARVPRRYSH